MKWYISKIEKLGKLESSLELAGNAGVYSQLFLQEQLFDTCTVLDIDDRALNKGIKRTENNLHINSRINFVKKDIFSEIDNNSKSVDERLRADVVFAMAITHHLILTQKLEMFAIVDKLYSLSNKYAIVEFCPLGLWSADSPEKIPEVPEWYTLDWFLKELERRFIILEYEDVEHRVSIVCEKRK